MEGKELPLYRMKIHDQEFGLDFVSIVDDPAILVKGLAFASQKKFEFDDVKQIIAGPAMIPDILIYRYDKETDFEYNVMFSKEDIEQIVEAFNASVKENKINVDHKIVSDSSFIKSSWIIEDKENDKSKMYGYDLPVGTWFIEVKVRNKEEFLKLKEEGKTSFSVEGVFDMIKIEAKKFIQPKLKFMKAKLKDGKEISISTDTLEVGATVTIIDEQGNETPAPEGEHTLESGEIIVLDSNGVIAEIKPAMEMEDDKKFEVTPEIITALADALKPAIAEMIKEAMSGNDNSDQMAKAIKKTEDKFEKQIKDLEETIKNTPAGGSFIHERQEEKPKSEKQKLSDAISFMREDKK
jgi:hypothetical protein